jgi:hypothetical protein
MSVATDRLETAKIPLSDQLTCHGFDWHTFEQAINRHRTSLKALKYNAACGTISEAAREKMSTTVLPHLSIGRGHSWNNPCKYVVTALALDDTIKTADDLSAALHRLEGWTTSN